MESQYITCSLAIQDAVKLREFFQRLHVTTLANDAILIYYDNMTALAYIKDPNTMVEPNILILM